MVTIAMLVRRRPVVMLRVIVLGVVVDVERRARSRGGGQGAIKQGRQHASH
jgi:hypothetical protein